MLTLESRARNYVGQRHRRPFSNVEPKHGRRVEFSVGEICVPALRPVEGRPVQSSPSEVHPVCNASVEPRPVAHADAGQPCPSNVDVRVGEGLQHVLSACGLRAGE